MGKANHEHWVERQQWQEIGSLSVQEFRQLARECLAEQNNPPEPARGPMTENEIWRAYQLGADWESFVAGVRLAEKVHGIGGDL
jgi:hypothetical protein